MTGIVEFLTARQLLDGPAVHVEATSWEWRGNQKMETGWSVTVNAFIEAEGLEALDEAWRQLRTDVGAGQSIGQPTLPR